MTCKEQSYYVHLHGRHKYTGKKNKGRVQNSSRTSTYKPIFQNYLGKVLYGKHKIEPKSKVKKRGDIESRKLNFNFTR